MAAFDDCSPRAHRDEVACSLMALFEAGDPATEQDSRFGQVGSDDRGQRNESPAKRVHGVVAEQPGSAFGHHHGIDDEIAHAIFGDRVRDGRDDLRARQHAGLGGFDAEVLHHRPDLLADQRDRRDRGRAMDAQRGERLQVGLDAGPAPRIGAGDRKRNWKLQARLQRRPAQ